MQPSMLGRDRIHFFGFLRTLADPVVLNTDRGGAHMYAFLT